MSYDYTLATQYAFPTSSTRGAADPNSTIRNTSTAVYDFNTGLVKQSTDPNGLTSTTAYNADTLRPTTSTSSTGAYSSFTYDEQNMKVTEEAFEAGGAAAGKTVKYLNGIGQVAKEESYGPNNVVDIVETKYNKLAQEWKRSRAYRAGETPVYTEKFYDLLGRVYKVVEPDASETKAFYNETPRPDSASNSSGNTVRVMDAWGRERWGRYDALNRLTEVVEPNPDRTLNPSGSIFTAGSWATSYGY